MGVLLLSAGLIGSLAACGDAAAPPSDTGPATLQVFQGNGQVSAPGSELPAALAVRAVTKRGGPRRKLAVAWSVSDDDSLAPLQAVTDDSGLVRATWNLGTHPGHHVAKATIDGQEIIFHATAAEPVTLGFIRPLSIVPLMASSEFVHPDVVRVPRGWAAARRFLAITPYPGGDITQEQPSVFASGELAAWEAPDGLTNPVERRPSKGYLSDPDVLYEPDRRELWLYYRQVTKANSVLLTTSTNGTQWTSPVTVAAAPNHMIVSPSVVRLNAGDWHMWSVNAGSAGCGSYSTTIEHRTSTDGLHWSAPTPAYFGDAAMPAWHIDVTWIPEFGQYWALYNGKPAGHCSTPALYLATSSDGVHWHTLAQPVLSIGAIPEFSDIVYRSTLEYEPRSDLVTLWYSGARYVQDTWVWTAAVQRVARVDLFRADAPIVGPVPMSDIRISTAPPLMRAP